MLEKVTRPTDNGVPVFEVANIPRDSPYTFIAYVRGGRSKFTRYGKPFVTLYLQDKHGVVIPGYIFEMGDFMQSGLDVTKVSHSLVKVTATENYQPKFGMSVLIDKVELISNPPASIASELIGTVGDNQTTYQTLLSAIEKRIGIKINLPYNICTSSYMDFYQGKVGGQCRHYLRMLELLDVWGSEMSDEELLRLYSTFVLYIFVNNNYIAAREEATDDIRLVTTLTASVSKYMEVLKAGDGAIEVIHLFFGYQPKDLFVRLVHHAAETNLRAMNELATYRSLPLSLEGDAGYGTIKRYAASK